MLKRIRRVRMWLARRCLRSFVTRDKFQRWYDVVGRRVWMPPTRTRLYLGHDGSEWCLWPQTVLDEKTECRRVKAVSIRELLRRPEFQEDEHYRIESITMRGAKPVRPRFPLWGAPLCTPGFDATDPRIYRIVGARRDNQAKPTLVLGATDAGRWWLSQSDMTVEQCQGLFAANSVLDAIQLSVGFSENDDACILSVTCEGGFVSARETKQQPKGKAAKKST